MDYEHTYDFFESRAHRAHGSLTITTTSYQDRNPELAEQRDSSEWELVGPFLHLDRRPTVLDVGCGVGRLARRVGPVMDRYLGVDFSPSILQLARQQVSTSPWADRCQFQELAAAGVGAASLIDTGPFSAILISGVMAYLNDEDVETCLRGVREVVAATSVVYLREPVARAERLTLTDHWSDDLEATYSACYRLPHEYRATLERVFTGEGFRFTLDTQIDAMLENRSETTQHFFVLERVEA